MTDDDYKKLMKSCGMPNSRSLYYALHQVADQVEQEIRKEIGMEWDMSYKKVNAALKAAESRYSYTLSVGPYEDLIEQLPEEEKYAKMKAKEVEDGGR